MGCTEVRFSVAGHAQADHFDVCTDAGRFAEFVQMRGGTVLGVDDMGVRLRALERRVAAVEDLLAGCPRVRRASNHCS